MTLHVNLLTPAKDGALWREVVAALPQRDVHYLPEYAALYEGDGVTAHAALLQTHAGTVLYPFLLRPVCVGKNVVQLDGSLANDITVPYGIGGPVCTLEGAKGADLYAAFDRAFSDWAQDLGIVSEFLCPHVFTGALTWVSHNANYHCELLKSVVVVDLEGDEAAVCGQLNRGHRSSINKARRSGVTVHSVEFPTATQYAVFNQLHRATLDRQGAALRWYFDSTFFARTRQALGPESCMFFTAEVEGEIAAWQIVLRYGATAYYHFAGSNTRFQALRPSTLLLHEVSLWAQRQGCARLYLGGGVTAALDDSVLQFKSGFSKKAAPLYGACRVLHKERYARLEHMQQAYEANSGIAPSNPNYFPAYRRT